jgi:uncharacterized protein DUF6590
MAYSIPDRPALLPGERGNRLLPAIRINKTNDASYHLKPSSRIHFSKPFTFEHNLPISVFGQVADQDLGRFLQYVQGCMDD